MEPSVLVPPAVPGSDLRPVIVPEEPQPHPTLFGRAAQAGVAVTPRHRVDFDSEPALRDGVRMLGGVPVRRRA